MSAKATSTPSHQDDSKVLLKEETERQHESTELKGHKTDRSVTESRHTRDNGIRSQKETVVFDNSFMLQPLASLTMRSPSGPGNTWPPAQDITVSHCDCLALVGPVQWSPQTEEQGRGLSLCHKARDENKGHPTPAPGKRATKRHSMEHPMRPAEEEARMKSAFRIRKTHFVCPEELHWAPIKFWRTRETTQEWWQNWTGPPDHKRLRGQRNNSGEREVPALQNEKALRTESQPLKAETDNP